MIGNTGCPMCDSGNMGATWTRDIITGAKTPHEAVLFFQMRYEDIMEHVHTHEIKQDPETGELQSPDFYLNELLRLLRRMKDWVDYLGVTKTSDRQTIETAVKVSREIRSTIESLATLQGRLGSTTNVNVRIQNIEANYFALTAAIMTDACPECRTKILEKIESLPAIEVCQP